MTISGNHPQHRETKGRFGRLDGGGKSCLRHLYTDVFVAGDVNPHLVSSRNPGLEASPVRPKYLSHSIFMNHVSPASSLPVLANDHSTTAAWRLLPSLPDPIGFGGMFGGVLGGWLVVGGGSQFSDKPFWLEGTKAYSDRIFVLDSPGGKWREHEARLPQKLAHFASAATADAIYLVGGLNSGGAQKQGWEIRAEGENLKLAALPDFPATLCYAAAAVVGARLFVVGGQQQPGDKGATVETWSLDLGQRESWQREPDLPGSGVFVTSAAGTRDLWVFGGLGFGGDGKLLPSRAAFRLPLDTRRWEKLGDLPHPRVGAVTPCPVMPDGRIMVVGGYEAIFPGASRDDPGFSTASFIYDPVGNRWVAGPVLPPLQIPDRDSPGDAGPGPMIAAPGVVWHDLAVIVGGEVRSSVRTPAVLAWPMRARIA